MPEEIMLNYLGSSYFHQDFDLDADSPIALVEVFAVEDGLQSVQIFYVELAEILASGLDEDGARKLWMDDAGSQYDPADDGVRYLEWLRRVLVVVGQVLRSRWLTPRESIGYE